MLIGIPKEIKDHEYRVGATPSGVREIILAGHKVIVEKNAGLGVDFSDQQYINAGAKIIERAEDVYADAEMILKVKEPQQIECSMIKKGQIIFSFLHLAAEPTLTKMLVDAQCIAIAFETVSAADNSLPLLAPMSEVAGKLSIQAGAKALEKSSGGRGILLGGVAGVAPANVVILGGDVVMFDKSLNRIRYLCDIFGNSATILYASIENIEHYVLNADLVIGAVLIPGASAPKLITKEMVKKMKPGAVMVDISIDQGGCFETSKPTSHSKPTYITDNVVHYCVTNMPGAVARTSTEALENATLPFTLALSNKGYRKALTSDIHLQNGLNVIDGKITHKAVADFLGYQYYNPQDLL